MAVFSLFKLVLTSTLLGNAFALPSSIDVEETAVASKLDERSTCLLGNTALSRDCWVEGYDVSTDFDTEWPTTGVTRYYDWTITNTTCAPDGTSRICLLINGVYPGPEVCSSLDSKISEMLADPCEDYSELGRLDSSSNY